MHLSNSFSIATESLNDFQDRLNTKIAENGKPSLGILFINADLDIEGINNLLCQLEIKHIGGSSSGEFMDGTYKRGLYTALFMYMPENYFRIYNSHNVDSYLSGHELGIFAKQSYQNPGIFMLIASKDTQTNNCIHQIQEATSTDIPLYGGHAFDNIKFEKYTVFTNCKISHKGVVAVVFDCDKVEMHGDSYSGWDSMGTTHVVTKARENELLEIDGRPALDMFSEYFDYFDVEKAAKGEEENIILGNHPIKVHDESGATNLLSAMHIDVEKRSMFFYSSIEEGTKFKFCNNPKLEITDHLINRIQELKDKVNEVDCALITSCYSRHLTLGPFFKKEVQRLYDIWEKPMVGFLSGGEIGNVAGANKSYFHNVSCVFTGFKMK